MSGCYACNSYYCDGSCDQAWEAQMERRHYEEQEPNPWDDPNYVFEYLCSEYLQDKLTEEQFIAEATCLQVIDNFKIIKVIQDKKETKQKDSTNA